VNPLSRKAAITVGTLATAATLATGAGVASAATSTPSAHPEAAAGHPRVDRLVKRETKAAGRIDKAADRLVTRSGKLATRVDALADGAKKTDALAKLADLATRTAAAKADDAKVLAALKTVDVTNVAATEATLKVEKLVLKAAHADNRAARKDVRAVLSDLKK
jgi:hypothetical protein